MLKRHLILSVGFVLITFLGIGCANGVKKSTNRYRNTPKHLTQQQEKKLEKMSRFIYPGLTLNQANELIGWNAGFRAGNWYWNPDGMLLVQTTHSNQDINKEAIILNVYDRYHNRGMEMDRVNKIIRLGPVPRP